MKRLAILFVVLIAFVHTAVGQKGADTPSSNYKVAVNVDLVIFNVTVTDTKGRLVKGLSKDDFRIC